MEIWKAMVVLVAVLLVAPLASPAEDTNATPARGARVRATTTSGQIVGKLMMRDEKTLRIETKLGKEIAIHIGELTGLEESRRPSRRGRGALLGFALGAATGAILGASSNSKGCDPSRDAYGCPLGTDPLFSNDQSAVMGAVVFGGLGALAGALIAPGEKWMPVESHPVSVTVAPIRGRGVAVRLAIAF